MKRLFERCDQNPIITPDHLPFEAAGVSNPGATEQDGYVVLLLRVEDRAGNSNIYVARSKDGIENWDIDPDPLLRHGIPRWRYETWGCEDARVTYLEAEKRWYITYTAYSANGAAVAIARTDDLAKAERIFVAIDSLHANQRPNLALAALFVDLGSDA